METAKLLDKKLGPLPVYGWLGLTVMGGSAALYFRARKAAKDSAVVPSASDATIDPTASGDAAFLYYPNQAIGFQSGGQLYGNGTVDYGTSPATTGPAITVVVGDGETVDPSLGVDTGGGPPEGTANAIAPRVGLPTGWAKGSTISGKSFKGALGHHVAGHGQNKNGRYTTHELIFANGKRQKYNHYTSGKSKGKWTGPF